MSKGLEALKIIGNSWFGEDNYDDMYIKDYFEEELDTIEKELKALEIIKNKRLAWVWFIDNKLSLEDYNKSIDFLICEPKHSPKKLTQEEYDLLKEVL